MQNFQVNQIGKISIRGERMSVELEQEFIPALRALEGFSHINILWWFSSFDTEEARNTLEVQQPYKKAPDIMGIFATRSPIRPNPIALSTAEVIHIDYEKGILEVAYIDADNNTPVLDIKPYTPSIDRVEEPTVPKWCSHWPMSQEKSGDFPWEEEFNF